ncbi:MAG: DUF3794 domain-containing protein [Oscillospiraceae bacterium]
MDLKVNKETFSTSESVLDTGTEQAVELDYILPDYYPDIFRVLKCRLLPRIVSHSINGEKLSFDLVAVIRVMYLSEGSNAVSCIEQRLNFTRSVDMTAPAVNPAVTVTPRADYVNCRVVNQRRLDVRGAVSTRVKITGERQTNVVSDAFGANIQLKKTAISVPSKRLTAAKRVTVIDELELGASKPPVKSVLRSDCTVIPGEQKIISGKLVTKGEANVAMLYASINEDGTDGLEAVKFTIPFSQIIDIEGIDDSFESIADITPTSCDITAKGDGVSTELECELVLLVNCTAVKFAKADVVTDSYSTSNEVSNTVCDAKLERMPVPINENHTVKQTLTYQEGDISAVCDAWSDVSNVTGRFSFDTGEFVISGNVSFCVMAKNTAGCPIYLEGDTAFEHIIKTDSAAQGSTIDPKVCVASCTYNLVGAGTVEVKAELRIGGYLYEAAQSKLISDISVDSESKKDQASPYALKLYFGDKNEDIWDIAKKYATSVAAILEENDLNTATLPDKGMILIPLVQ